MRQPFPQLWAAGAPLVRREPSGSELNGGIECGPADEKLFNEVFMRGLEAHAELGAIVEDQGMVYDPLNLAQVLAAIKKMFLISENEDHYVSGVGENTLRNKLAELNQKMIAAPAKVRIFLSPGEHVIENEPIIIGHRDGAQISIIGAPLSLAFPTKLYMDPFAGTPTVPDSATVEGKLRSVYPTVIRVVGPIRSGLFMVDGALGSLENVLMIGDKSTGQHGLMIGDWQNQVGTGNMRLVQCSFHNFGVDGIRVNYNSAVQLFRVTSTNNGVLGVRIANMSAATSQDQLTCCFNTAGGVACTDESFFEVIGIGEFSKNGGSGVEVSSGSYWQGAGATALRCTKCSPFGFMAVELGGALLQNLEVNGNAVADVYASGNGVIRIANPPIGTAPLYSPAVNSTGNKGGQIYTDF